MNRLLAVLAMFFAGFLAVAEVAEAKRMGGGRSLGAQRQATPASPPAANVTPAAPAAAAAAKAAPAAASGASRWLGPLAGLAAGLGIAALLSHLGLSEGFASFLLLALIVIGGAFLIRMLLARRAPARSPLQYAGTGPGLGNTPGGYETSPAPMAAGNNRFEPVLGGSAGVAPATTAQFGRFPPGFNAAPFVEQAKLQFNKLQAAYDSGNRKALSEVMTPEMYAEIAAEIAGRGVQTPTQVVHLDAELLEVREEDSRYWASVHFKGSLHEDGSVLPKDFEEIWNLVKPVDGSSGWLLAGIEQVPSA